MANKLDEKLPKIKRRCHICKKIIIGSTYKFKSHLYYHNAIPPRFICAHCPKHFYRRDIFKKHVASHLYSISQRSNFICDHCGRAFVYKNNLISHLLKIHDDVSRRRDKKYSCMACGAIYCERRLLKYHIRKLHFNLKEKKPSYVNKMVNETWVEQVLQSNVCVQMTKINNNVIEIKKCDTKIKLQKEEKMDNTVQEYISSEYIKEFKSNYSKAICDYCHKEMLKKSLVAHIRERHLKLRKFNCNVCGRTFKRRYQFIDHKCGKPSRRSKMLRGDATANA